MRIKMLGIDIAKNSFQLHGVGEHKEPGGKIDYSQAANFTSCRFWFSSLAIGNPGYQRPKCCLSAPFNVAVRVCNRA